MARARRQRRRADRRRHRQPVGADGGKRGVHGFDGAKKVDGRKRHLATDVLGLVVAVLVTPANILDRHAAPDILERAKKKAPTIKKVFVDSGYNGACKTKLERQFDVDVEVVSRRDLVSGVWQGPQLPLFAALPAFQVLPRRWVVERTNAWTTRPRRLCKDQDLRIDVAEAWIWLTHASLLMRRTAHAILLDARAAAGATSAAAA